METFQQRMRDLNEEYGLSNDLYFEHDNRRLITDVNNCFNLLKQGSCHYFIYSNFTFTQRNTTIKYLSREDKK